MQFIDTHTHLYLEQFEVDRASVIERALQLGVTKMLLPNVDEKSIVPMLQMVNQYPGVCYPMMGLHPTSVEENYTQQIQHIVDELKHQHCIAIGEVGVDLYWDKTLLKQQQHAFEIQLQAAVDMHLPVVIHMRDSFDETFAVVKNFSSISGVFHCYSGTLEQAEILVSRGFYLGIGGVITYKKSNLPEVVEHIPLNSLLIETDSPYLSPMPYRGKRNESAYVIEVAKKIAEIKNIPLADVAAVTTQSASKLFGI